MIATIEKRYQIEADGLRVFTAWLSSDYAVPPVAFIDADEKPGGMIRLVTSEDTGAAVMQGKILEYERGRHLRYTWHWEGTDNTSIVDVNFSHHNEQTEIALIHSGLDSEESRQRHSAGWDAYIEGLRAML